LVACGGAAKNGVRDAEERYGLSNVKIISRDGDSYPPDFHDALIRDLQGKRIVIPYLALGGEFGTEAVRNVIKCAREVGCSVVSVFTIPFSFESTRRNRAFDHIAELSALSDCSLVMDMQKFADSNPSIVFNREWTSFLKMSDHNVMYSVASIVNYMEGPFFSTFKDKLYSFIITSDVVVKDATRKAWEGILYDNTDPTDDAVIMMSSKITSAEEDDLRNMVAMDYGIIPDIVRVPSIEESKVIVFRSVKSF